MVDTLRLVSSEDVGKDEASVQSLLKKHKVGQQAHLIAFIKGIIFETSLNHVHNGSVLEHLKNCKQHIIMYRNICLDNFQDVTEELKNYQSVIESLHEQAASLGEQVS